MERLVIAFTCIITEVLLEERDPLMPIMDTKIFENKGI